MDEETLVNASQLNCNHKEEYNERFFDVLNGLELTFTCCIDCHKIVSLEAKKLRDR